MANYFVDMKIGQAGLGQAHYDYISREGKYSKGQRYEDLVYKESANLPKWGEEDKSEFWLTADIYENINGRSYREIVFSLPNELPDEENINLTKSIIEKHLGNDFPYSYAIHSKVNDEGIKNIHCHLMFSERKLDGIERDQSSYFKRTNNINLQNGGAKKDRSWIKKEKLREVRESIADQTNFFLEKNNCKDRVDHRKLIVQLKEAIEKKDFDKIESLDREPINTQRYLLMKSKKINFQHKNTLKEKTDFMKEYKDVLKKSKDKNIEKKVLDILSEGEYNKLNNEKYRIYRELKEKDNSKDKNEDYIFITKLYKATIETEIKELEDKYKSTNEYKVMYENLKVYYTNKLKLYDKKLEYQSDKTIELKLNVLDNNIKDPINLLVDNNNFDSVNSNSLLEFKTYTNENPVEHNLKINKGFSSPEEANFKMFENRFKIYQLKNKIDNHLEYEAINKLTSNKLRDISLISSRVKKLKIKDTFKDTLDMIEKFENTEIGRKTIEREKEYIKNVNLDKIKVLGEENTGIEQGFSSDKINQNKKYQKLIVENYLKTKVEYKKSLEAIKYHREGLEIPDIESSSKKYLALIINAKKSNELEEKINFFEDQISKFDKNNVKEATKEFVSKSEDQIRINKEKLSRLDKVNEKNINSLAYNKISNGEYFRLSKIKNNLLKEKSMKNKELDKLSVISILKKKQIRSTLKNIDSKIQNIDTNINSIKSNQEAFTIAKNEITSSLENAKKILREKIYKNTNNLRFIREKRTQNFINHRDFKNNYSFKNLVNRLNKKENQNSIRKGEILNEKDEFEL